MTNQVRYIPSSQPKPQGDADEDQEQFKPPEPVGKQSQKPCNLSYDSMLENQYDLTIKQKTVVNMQIR